MRALVLLALLASVILNPALAYADDALMLASPGLADNGVLTAKNGGNLASNPNCSGENVSPPLVWANAPAATRSFALLMVDPDGRRGLGVVHWVAYGIAASQTGFAEGEGGQATAKYVHGIGTRGVAAYTGPCAPPGTGMHHYIVTLIATDLAVDALPPGLTREELLSRLDGHALAATSIVARSGHEDSAREAH